MLLGILASSTAVGGDYESIATVTVGSGGAAEIAFTSIGTDWTHLQLRFIARSAVAGNTCAFFMRFNNDSGTNYYPYHEIFGDGSTAAAYANGSSGTRIQFDQYPAANRASGIFGAGVVDILDYQSTNKNKTVRHLSGYDSNGAGAMVFGSGLWYASPAAITTIKLTENSAGNFAQYSHFALYGIKSA